MADWHFDLISFALGAVFLLFFGIGVVAVADYVERRRLMKKIEREERERRFARK